MVQQRRVRGTSSKLFVLALFPDKAFLLEAWGGCDVFSRQVVRRALLGRELKYAQLRQSTLATSLAAVQGHIAHELGQNLHSARG